MTSDPRLKGMVGLALMSGGDPLGGANPATHAEI